MKERLFCIARRCTDFERYRAKLSAERGKVQTEEDVIRALLATVQQYEYL